VRAIVSDNRPSAYTSTVPVLAMVVQAGQHLTNGLSLSVPN
jgi:hypothetical protein